MDAVTRFHGLASCYDQARPTPPRELVSLLCGWIGVPRPDVVDLGAGSGLATAIWSGTANSVVAVEPGADMRAVAAARLAELPDADSFRLVEGTAEDTGLPDGCADVVTASQAMHWFDLDRALPEIARLLRPGGVYAAIDCDFPPAVGAEVDEAYLEFESRQCSTEERRGLRPPSNPKHLHLSRLADSGLFRHTQEICLHSRETGDADRVIAIVMSQGGTAAALADGMTEDEIGLTRLREVAARTVGPDTPFWWSYRVRLARK
jgi:SAM-dependent methyltransferase